MEKGNPSKVSLIFSITLCLKAPAGTYIVWNKGPGRNFGWKASEPRRTFSSLLVQRREKWKARTCEGRGGLVNGPGFPMKSVEGNSVETQLTNTVTRLKSSQTLTGYS